ncbi:MAG TPA: Calx-beta domain-containing protein, partial [Saprospiraceae bacterium]|nr:Calx-beta domain-containing protein [Saprospiraceae bacterium]
KSHLGDVISNQTCADRYTLTRTYMATDACGNTATCAQIITVDDQTAPTITCPSNVTVSCTSEVPAADPNTLVVSDNCDGPVTKSHLGDVISNQTCVDHYTLTRNYMATDACGNAATCAQIITVNDQTAPTISCSPNVTVSCTSDVPAIDSTILVVSDNCDGPVIKSHLSDQISNQTCADRYTLTRTYLATDACGNSATCNQIITVNDQLTPTAYFIVNGNPNAEEAGERCDEVALLLERGTDSDQSQPATVTITVNGTATSGADFSPIATSYIIPAGQNQLVVPINIVADLLPEGSETIVISLVNSCSCDGTKDTLTILDYVPMTDTNITITICTSGDGATLTANPVGGTAPFIYLWSTNETTPSIFVNPTVTTSYAVTIIDACSDTAANIFLVQVLPFAETTENVSFCAGDSVVIDGETYTQPGTVKDTLPGMNGACDTLATYILQLLPQVSFTDTIAFCPGESVVIDGETFTQPGTVKDTLPGLNGACDTLATYILQLLPQVSF